MKRAGARGRLFATSVSSSRDGTGGESIPKFAPHLGAAESEGFLPEFRVAHSILASHNVATGDRIIVLPDRLRFIASPLTQSHVAHKLNRMGAMNTAHSWVRRLAAAVVFAGGAIFLSGTNAWADQPCDVWEWYEAQQVCDSYCNPWPPPYYCGYAWACTVDEYGQINALCTCVYYGDEEPCPTNPCGPNGC